LLTCEKFLANKYELEDNEIVSDTKEPSLWLPKLVGRFIGIVIVLIYLNLPLTFIKKLNVTNITTFIFAFILAYYASVFFHEAGHLLFGTLARFKFTWASVGKIQVYCDTHQMIRLRFVKQFSWTGGFAAMHTTNEHLLRWRDVAFILGGPATNFLLFFAFGFLYNYTPQGTFLSSFVASSIFSSLALGFFSLIPSDKNGFANDGLQLLRLLRGGPLMRRSMAIMLLYGSALEGKGCEEWNAKWIEDSLAIQDNSSTEALANFFAYDWALDRKAVSKAEVHLNRGLGLVEKLDPATTTALYWSQAYFLAIHKHDAVGARAALEKAGSNPLALAFYPLRSEAAVLFAEGHFEEAKAKAEEGIEVYKELGSPKHGQEEFDQLEDILAKTENSLASSSSMVA
jgi:hypothetical protein